MLKLPKLMHPDYTGGAAGMVEKVTGIIQEHLGDTATLISSKRIRKL